MRTSLIVALLVPSVAIAGVFAGSFVLAPEQFGNSFTARKAPHTPAVPLQKLGRETLSTAELRFAIEGGLLPPGTKSLLTTQGAMRHGDFKWNEEGVLTGKLSIWIDLRTQIISVFRDGHEIGTAVVVYGAESMESPTGRFPIRTKSKNYHSRAYDAPMPYSLFINDSGVALHGSQMSSRRATHGCIGLPVEFARLLFNAAEIGDEVQIVRSNVHSSAAARPRVKS